MFSKVDFSFKHSEFYVWPNLRECVFRFPCIMNAYMTCQFLILKQQDVMLNPFFVYDTTLLGLRANYIWIHSNWLKIDVLFTVSEIGDVKRVKHFINTRMQFMSSYIPDCPPELPTLGCSCGPEYQACNWKTGKGWQTCGGFQWCPGRWDPGSSLHEGWYCSFHPSCMAGSKDNVLKQL